AAIIGAVEPHVVAVKLQLACFEPYGPPGMDVFSRLCREAQSRGLLVIADAKRGDIGISAACYSAAFLGRPPGLTGGIDGYGVDAMTVNPLFGSDGIEPFISDCEAYGTGIFVLAKTSNPASAELQDLTVGSDSRPFYEHVAELVRDWGSSLTGAEGYSSVGAVVGATQPEIAIRLREVLPKAFFLMPGYGAQGATAADVAPVFDNKRRGALVSASRSIIYPGNDQAFERAAAAAASRMQEELWTATGQKPDIP
ncbi:MAG: orotidine-5'-phosphate decarboxylase, partial [Actinomycetota bacterium]